MELYQLEAFEAIVAQGSFTRAADALCLSPPAVTRQIAGLEAELKTLLFDRLGRSVQMTAAGEALHGYAQNIVRLALEARQAVGEVSAGEAGRVNIGASNTLATYVLPPLLRQFRQTHPRVDISIQTGVSAQILEMARVGVTDVGLVTGGYSWLSAFKNRQESVGRRQGAANAGRRGSVWSCAWPCGCACRRSGWR